MKWKSLQEFQVIAKLENITRASDSLYIAQPALSRTLKDLENELGTPLFYRKGKSLVLNEYGKIVFDYVQQVQQNLKACAEELQIYNQSRRQPLRVVNQIALASSDQLIIQFHRDHPELFLSFMLNDSEEPFSSLSCDFVIHGSFWPDVPSIQQIPLLQEELCVAVYPEHRFAGRDSLALTELTGEKLILTQSGAELRQQIDAYFQQVGIRPVPTAISDDFRFIASLIRSRAAISIVPRYSWGYANYPDIRLIPISHPACHRTLVLSWNKEKELSPGARIFRDYALQFYSRIAEKG